MNTNFRVPQAMVHYDNDRGFSNSVITKKINRNNEEMLAKEITKN